MDVRKDFSIAFKILRKNFRDEWALNRLKEGKMMDFDDI